MRFTHRLGTKIVSFVLLCILVLTLFISVCGVILIYDSGIHRDGGEELLNHIYEEYCWDPANYDSVNGYFTDRLGKIEPSVNEWVNDPQRTNLRYTMYFRDGIPYYTNVQPDEDIKIVSTQSSRIFRVFENTDKETRYVTFDTYSNVPLYMSDIEKNGTAKVEWVDTLEMPDGKITAKLIITYGVYVDIFWEIGALKTPIVKDDLYYKVTVANLGIAVKDVIFIYIGIAVALCITLLVFLMCGAGHKKGVSGITLNKFHKIPLDVYIFINALIVMFIWDFCENFPLYEDLLSLIMISSVILVLTAMLLALIITLAARFKGEKWYRNTAVFFVLRLTYRIAKKICFLTAYLLRKIPLFYKTLLLMIFITLVEGFWFIAFGPEDFPVLWVLEKIVLCPLVIYCVLCMRALQKTAQMIAKGDTEYKADTKYMVLDFKEHGENLNGISGGIACAVAEKVKSERMKTELITNVSHDIKTPLTSIINYVNLIKRDGLDSESAKEYLDVLEKNSNRLKKLTEDIVEASKASTGNIQVDIEETDVNVFLSQTAGEYEEELKKRDLSLVLDLPEESVKAYADGRLLWRVFENLMSNICKYSMPNTRVYLSARSLGKNAVITFKNISKAPLNIDESELTERFVQGDKSRNTEGSGLGLSIAKSLVELQNGQLDITIDGDLFKVTVTI